MEITIYSTATCPYCHLEKEYLKGRGVSFREVRVDQDRHGLEEMVRKSGQLGVPFTTITLPDREEGILGFDQEAIDELIGATP